MRKIKWGVLGTASIFMNCTYPGMLQADNCDLYAIAGRSCDKVNEFKNKCGFNKSYYDYNELLADPEVEAVYIPLPNSLHYEWTIKALKAKKHVLCEKPLAPNESMAARMFETADANGVCLMEAFAYQHSPFIKEIKSQINNGMIGNIRYIDCAFITSDYDNMNIRMRKDCLGGCTYDLGVYNTSFILSMLENEPREIKAVSSMNAEGIDTLTSVLMEYQDGIKASFTCGMVLATEKDRRIDRFEIAGTKGSIRGKCFEFNGEGELSYILTTFDGEGEIKVVNTPQNYRLEIEQLGRCICQGETPVVTKEFSLANARMIDRILEEIKY